MPVPLGTAMLGGEIEVPHLDGAARLAIEPGSENGRIYRLRGQGLSKLGNDRAGATSTSASG